jgi:hypothetical protein
MGKDYAPKNAIGNQNKMVKYEEKLYTDNRVDIVSSIHICARQMYD